MAIKRMEITKKKEGRTL